MSIQYSIDKSDRIQFINEAWLQFACQNAGGHLNRAHVIGKPIWEFIKGEDLSHAYGQIFKAVRTRQQASVFKFRCDSAGSRRYFQLTVSPLQENELLLSTHSLREDLRNAVPLLDPDVKRGKEFLAICSWCIKARLPTNEWVELEDAVNRLNLLMRETMPSLTHGICADCQITIEHELKSLRSR